MPDTLSADGLENTDQFDFELRADHVTEEVLSNETVRTDLFTDVHEALTDRSLCLIVGPRGSGKTHVMRYTWLRCIHDAKKPLCVYVSFNRYLRLEPLLSSKIDAIADFQTWVLVRILRSLQEVADRLGGNFNINSHFELNDGELDALLATLERAATLTSNQELISNRINIQSVLDVIEELTQKSGRRRAVLLLDDAALTLTPEYMVEFFDIVRVLKSKQIAPKCSVYPGTTEYGPRFHARQEAREVQIWINVDDANYIETIVKIGRVRAAALQQGLPVSVQKQMALACFGIPRAYLTLLRSLSELGGASQANINRVIQQHREGILAEYRSLSDKMPKFQTLISSGEALFTAMIDAIRQANSGLANEKQLLVGIERDSFSHLSARMIKFLIEAGLVYEAADVSHGGPDRTYRRFMPHLAALMAVRAFSVGRRGQSSSEVVDFLLRRQTKHPVRRSLETLLGQQVLDGLRIDLPHCQNCGTQRISEAQKFCHNCGAQLVDGSNFARLMKLTFDKVPGLTDFQRRSLDELKLNVIGDLIALEDPGTELHKVFNIGQKRSVKIINVTQAYIDEFLS